MGVTLGTEELLLSHVDDVFDEIRATVLPSPTRSVGLQELLATTFAEWAAHADSLRLALQIEDKDQVIERIRLHVDDLMDAFVQYGREDVIAYPMHEYVVDFVTGGVYMLLRSWSRDGLTAPSTQMAELVYSLISGHINPRDTRLPCRVSAEAGPRSSRS
jgi:hypothetical protein